jgi:hypothetical protein
MNQLSQMLMMGAAVKTSPFFTMPFGTFTDGGYFTGIINQGGSKYAIIVAPKSSGFSSNLRYKNTSTAAPAATQTLNNGSAATAAMVAAGNSTEYPAAHFCNNLTIGGFSDWYLPARDELELCYRNLKPTTDANDTSNRAKSSINYPEGNDVSGDTMGVNRNSDPTGAAYTSGNPAQTSVLAFQADGSEAFDIPSITAVYWSSSEASVEGAWEQSFGPAISGSQFSGTGSFGKANFRAVRAVRRVKI